MDGSRRRKAAEAKQKINSSEATRGQGQNKQTSLTETMKLRNSTRKTLRLGKSAAAKEKLTPAS